MFTRYVAAILETIFVASIVVGLIYVIFGLTPDAVISFIAATADSIRGLF